jgi:hypothetical protein
MLTAQKNTLATFVLGIPFERLLKFHKQNSRVLMLTLWVHFGCMVSQINGDNSRKVCVGFFWGGFFKSFILSCHSLTLNTHRIGAGLKPRNVFT